jgi:hypothetical protein
MPFPTRAEESGKHVDSEVFFPKMKRRSTKAARFLLLLLLLSVTTNCTGSIYDWRVRTNSTPVSPPFRPANLAQHRVAVFPAITMPGLRGNEFALGHYLGYIAKKGAPDWKVVTEIEASSRINRKGLATDFARMRSDYDQSSILDLDTLRRIAKAVDARYIFQPRLVGFSQIMTDRWMLPGLNVRLLQTRSSIMRISLQLWDAETGDLVWVSIAETTMSNEAVSQDPVYFQDIAVATLGSMMVDFMNERTASEYTPLNKFLDALLYDTKPKEMDRNDMDTKGLK